MEIHEGYSFHPDATNPLSAYRKGSLWRPDRGSDFGEWHSNGIQFKSWSEPARRFDTIAPGTALRAMPGAPKKRPLARRGLIACPDYESRATLILIN